MPDSSSSGSSSSASADPELAAALDSFVHWAHHEAGGARIDGLPPLRLTEGLEPGSVLGDYELVRRLGVGGMGVVFEARQRRVAGRRVAVKVLRNAFETEESSTRFRREVAAVAELDHPGIVPIVDAHVDAQAGGGAPYYVMKYVEGVSLARMLRELRNGPGRPRDTLALRSFVERGAEVSAGAEDASSSPPDIETSWEADYVRWVARIGLQVAEALQYAHEHGFVHRDVKPSNVMVTPRGRAVLLDFGLVAGAGDETLTHTGEFLGTLGYASPEQVRGEGLDTRSDVYSLGATLYELLALRRPIEARTRNELVQRIDHGVPSPLDRALPADLRTIVACALAKSSARRYATPGALAQDLRAFLAGQPIQARPPGYAERVVRTVRRHPRVLATVAGVVLTVVGLRMLAYQRAGTRVASGLARLEECRDDQVRWSELSSRHGELHAREPRDEALLQETSRELRATAERVASGHAEARALLGQAFEHVAGFAPAHRALARLAAEELAFAWMQQRDVLEPNALAELEAALAYHDSVGEHAHLLQRHGRVSLASEPTGALVSVLSGTSHDAAPLFVGRTPVSRLELPEGSYLALLEADGYAPARLPFLVRREACYARADARPSRELSVELLPADRIPEGFVHVASGETLVSDDPPRWESVGSFLVQRREVTWGQLVSWARTIAWEPGSFPEAAPIRRSADGSWELDPDVDPDLPIQGCTPMEASALSEDLDGALSGVPEGWYASLPRVAEWVRAARGADGRPYPWGWDFEWSRCANYLSGPVFRSDAQPIPVGSFPGDESPFGVLDLAGSMAETTADLYGPRPGEYAVCGGSYRSADPLELRVTALGRNENARPLRDAGFRPVLRPLPAWAVAPDGEAADFRDDFERADGAAVGNGWIELAGTPLGLRTNPNEPERCTVEAGQLVLQGGEGSFSESSSAWHRLCLGRGDWRVRAEMRAMRVPSDQDGAAERRFGIHLRRDLRPRTVETLSLTMSFEGHVVIQRSHGSGPGSIVTGAGPAPCGAVVFELARRGARVEGRIWRADSERSVATPIVLCSDVTLDASFLGFEAPNYVGTRVEIAWVEVELERSE